MLKTTSSQLQNETMEWIETLRRYRSVFQKASAELQTLAGNGLSKVAVQKTGHFENQLQIQLVNIHDLKQKLKTHHRKIQLEAAFAIRQQTVQEHEDLFEQFTALEGRLRQLSKDSAEFISGSF